jgi:hypothetical protein
MDDEDEGLDLDDDEEDEEEVRKALCSLGLQMPCEKCRRWVGSYRDG